MCRGLSGLLLEWYCLIGEVGMEGWVSTCASVRMASMS